jgi:hypothetical protein
MIDGVIQKSTPETQRWARRAATHVPSSRLLTEQVEAPVIPVLEPERKAEERAKRTAYRVIENLEETE